MADSLRSNEQQCEHRRVEIERPGTWACVYCDRRFTLTAREVFVSRLERMQANGDAWLTIPAVLALLNDCETRAPHVK